MHRRKLFWQLSVSYLALTSVALVIAGLYASRSLRAFHYDKTRADLRARAVLVRERVGTDFPSSGTAGNPLRIHCIPRLASRHST